jgi:hypothetical protein
MDARKLFPYRILSGRRQELSFRIHSPCSSNYLKFTNGISPTKSSVPFLPWAEVLLKDFEEADRYLVHIPSFFRNIADLKEVEETFGLSEEDEEKIREFWKAFYDREQGALKKNFYNSWRHLGSIYKDFREALEAKGWAYEGMAYRKFSESLQEQSLTLPYSTICFAGLYALSKSEESDHRVPHQPGKGQVVLGYRCLLCG